MKPYTNNPWIKETHFTRSRLMSWNAFDVRDVAHNGGVATSGTKEQVVQRILDKQTENRRATA